MNTERLLTIIEDIREQERVTNIQRLLTEVNSHLTNLVNQPQQPQHQVSLSESLKNLRRAIGKLTRENTPARIKTLQEIGAGRFFTQELVDEIDDAISANGMTPAVAQQTTQKLIGERQQFLQEIEQLESNLHALGFKADQLESGEAEVGFQIPRGLFKDDLHGLISELKVLERVIRIFDEIATGSAGPIVVRQISTTDPLFWFLLAYAAVCRIGRTTTWALDTWKKVEDIRLARAQTKQTKSFTNAEIESFFGKKIEDTLKAAIGAETKALLSESKADAGRKNELAKAISWALEALLARIERGLTVEIRFLPPAEGEPEGDDAKQQSEEMNDIASQLVFPAPSTDPVLGLPKMPPSIDLDSDNEAQQRKPK